MKTEGKWSGGREMEKIEASDQKRGHECKAIYTDNREEAGTEGKKPVMRQKRKAGRGDAV